MSDKLLEYFQARDQAFLSLNEKRIRLEEERERKRVEREAEIELKRHHLIVKVGISRYVGDNSKSEIALTL